MPLPPSTTRPSREHRGSRERGGWRRRPGPEIPADPRPTFDQVAEEYGDKIYSFAYRFTGDPDAAADLTQDVFVRVYGNLHRYQPGTFDGWLYRITKNLFLDTVRRRRTIRLEPLPEGEGRLPASPEPGPADVVERRTLETRLDRGLRELPDDFRLAVLLCDVEGLSYTEIVTATGWPLGTVRSRIHRGRRQLRDYLRADGDRAGAGGEPAGEPENRPPRSLFGADDERLP